jgi:hypothetical protein
LANSVSSYKKTAGDIAQSMKNEELSKYKEMNQ